MGIISGIDSSLQLGLGDTWGTAQTPTIQLSFTSEDIKYIPNYIEEDALVGNKTSGRMDVSGVKVEGSINYLVKPDNIGYVLGLVLGEEGDTPGDTSGDSVGDSGYTHAFTPIQGGTDSSLKDATIKVDRKVDTFGYTSCKFDTFSLSASLNDYLRASCSVRGYNEVVGDTLEDLNYSTLQALRFNFGKIKVDGDTWIDVQSFTFNYSNNLENDLWVMNGDSCMREIEPQKREITCDLETLYSTTTNTARTNKFKTGSTAALIITFESVDEIASGLPYKMQISMPLCYITDASPVVGGPERIKQNLVVKATENNSNEAVTITIWDAKSDVYV